MTGRIPRGIAVVLAALATAACGGPAATTTSTTPATSTPPATSDPADRLVLVSGRDDHGMVAAERVPVYAAVEGHRRTGTVADGTYARVLATDGQWLRVRTVEGRPTTGWVDDFFLRGVSRLVGAVPPCTAPLAGHAEPGGTPVVVLALRGARARVETLARPGAAGWVARSSLQELPPQGSHCGDVPPDDRHAHDRSR